MYLLQHHVAHLDHIIPASARQLLDSSRCFHILSLDANHLSTGDQFCNSTRGFASTSLYRYHAQIISTIPSNPAVLASPACARCVSKFCLDASICTRKQLRDMLRFGGCAASADYVVGCASAVASCCSRKLHPFSSLVPTGHTPFIFPSIPTCPITDMTRLRTVL